MVWDSEQSRADKWRTLTLCVARGAMAGFFGGEGTDPLEHRWYL